jgi:hypothetical protein
LKWQVAGLHATLPVILFFGFLMNPIANVGELLILFPGRVLKR